MIINNINKKFFKLSIFFISYIIYNRNNFFFLEKLYIKEINHLNINY